MKNLLTSFFFLITSLSLFSQNLKIGGAIEMGYCENSTSVLYKMYDGDIHTSTFFNNFEYGPLYTNLSIKVSYKGKFFVEGYNKTIMKLESGEKTFTPLLNDYGVDFYWKNERIQIGYFHSCLHPVVNDLLNGSDQFKRGSEDRIYLKVSFGKF